MNPASPARATRQPPPLPAAARGYLACTIVAALGLLAYWSWAWRGPTPDRPGLAALLLLLAALAQHFPLRLSPRYHVDASTAVYFAALLLLGAPAGMALVGVCQLVGGLTLWLRRDPRSGLRRRGLRGVAFNAAQQMLAAGIAGLVYFAFLPHAIPAPLDQPADLWALPLAAAALYLTNTGAVAVMVGLQRGRSPLAIWREGWREDLLEAAALAFLGLAAALLATTHAWALLLLALPAALLHLAQQRGLVQLEARQRAEVAHAEAEAARRGAAYLAGVSAALATSLDYHATLQRVAELAVQDLGDWCSVDVIERGGEARRVAIARMAGADDQPDDREPEEWGSPTGAAARVLLTGQPELYPELTPERWAQIAPDPGHQQPAAPHSALIVPLVARGRTLGALSLAITESARRYGAADLELAADLAGRAALAVDNARLYTEAHEALAARDRFLAIAAHELRTPVARLKAQAEQLRRRQARGQLDAARLEVGLVAIDEAASHFVRLTRDLLDVSRLQAGQLPLRHRHLDLATIAQAVAARECPRLDLGERLILTLPTGLPRVDADPDRLDQVLANLLENAAKYSPGGGPIEVAVGAEDGGVLLRVKDAGIGLPPGATETIFTPFGRAANATARRIPGLGLGLVICRDIAARHGGRLWAESAGEGQGTTMHLWLPIAQAGITATADAAD